MIFAIFATFTSFATFCWLFRFFATFFACNFRYFFPKRLSLKKSLMICAIFATFSGAGGWRSTPKRPGLPGRKGNTEKGKGRGQASVQVRSPLRRTWKRVLVRGAKVHACGPLISQNHENLQILSEFCWILTKFFRDFPKMQNFS